MPRANWNGQIIADAAADNTVTVEGNIYFPIDSVNQAHLQPSNHTSICPWKGTAHYYDVVVGDNVNKNAAWYYPEPKEAAKEIAGRVAFWKGVEVVS